MIVNKDNKVGWHLRVSSYFYALPHCLPACFSPSSKIFRIWLLSHRLFCWFLLVCSMKIWEALGHIKISKMQCCSVILSIQLIDNRVGYTCGMRTCESLQVRNGVDYDDTLDWQRLGSAHMVRHTQQLSEQFLDTKAFKLPRFVLRMRYNPVSKSFQQWAWVLHNTEKLENGEGRCDFQQEKFKSCRCFRGTKKRIFPTCGKRSFPQSGVVFRDLDHARCYSVGRPVSKWEVRSLFVAGTVFGELGLCFNRLNVFLWSSCNFWFGTQWWFRAPGAGLRMPGSFFAAAGAVL